jgi:hypothetical protein
MGSPFGSKQPAGRPETIGDKAPPLPKKWLATIQIFGEYQDCQVPEFPACRDTDPAFEAGFVFLGLRFSTQLNESTRAHYAA